MNTKEPLFIVFKNPFHAGLDISPLAKTAADDKIVQKEKLKNDAADRAALVKLYTSCIPALVKVQDDLDAVAAEAADENVKAKVEEFKKSIGSVGIGLLDFVRPLLGIQETAAVPVAGTPPIAGDTSAGNLAQTAPAITPPAQAPAVAPQVQKV